MGNMKTSLLSVLAFALASAILCSCESSKEELSKAGPPQASQVVDPSTPVPEGKLEASVLSDGKPVKSVSFFRPFVRKGRAFVEAFEDGSNETLNSENGVYLLDLKGEKAFYAQFSSPGLAPSSARWDGAKNVERRLTVNLQKGVEIGGVVVDDKGVPVKGAVLQLSSFREARDASELVSFALSTDGSGRWSCRLPQVEDSQLQIRFKKLPEGLTVGDKDLMRGNLLEDAIARDALLAKTWRKKLSPGRIVKGVVVDESGKPLEGASIILQRNVFKSSVDGSFSATFLLPSSLSSISSRSESLLIKKEGFISKNVIVEVSRNEITPLRIELEKGGDATLVVKGRNGEALKNLRVQSAFKGRLLDCDPIPPDGRVAVQDIGRNGSAFLVEADGMIPACAVLKPGDEAKIELAPAPSYTLRVVDSRTGEDLKDFSFSCKMKASGERFARGSSMIQNVAHSSSPRQASLQVQHSMASDVGNPDSIHFVVPDLKDGFILEFRVSAKGFKDEKRVVEVKKGDSIEVPETLVKMTPGEDSTQMLFVKTPDGSPAAGALASVRVTSPNGFSFSNETVSDDGRLVLHVSPEDKAFTSVQIRHKSGAATVGREDLKDGATVALSPFASISGRWSASAPDDAVLKLHYFGNTTDLNGMAALYSSLTDDRSFVFEKVLPGRFLILEQGDSWQAVRWRWGVCEAGKPLKIDAFTNDTTVEVKALLPDACPAEAKARLSAIFSSEFEQGFEGDAIFLCGMRCLRAKIGALCAEGASGFKLSAPLSQDGVFSAMLPAANAVNCQIVLTADGGYNSIAQIALKPGERQGVVDLRSNHELTRLIEFLKIPKSRLVCGVVSYPDGSPAEGVRVANFRSSSGECIPFGRACDTLTGKGGIFQVEGLPAVKTIECDVVPEPPYAMRSVSFSSSEQEPKEIVLYKKTIVKGAVKGMPNGWMIDVSSGNSSVCSGGGGDSFYVNLDYIGGLDKEGELVEVKVSLMKNDGSNVLEKKIKVKAGEENVVDLDAAEAKKAAPPAKP